jgi:cytidylate kinase
MRIAIDGPVGAGKSSAGRALAKRLGLRFLDTGLLYRAITLGAIEAGLGQENEDAIVEFAHRCDIQLVNGDGARARLLLDGRDVTPLLRGADVDRFVSFVSAIPGVRDALAGIQRRIAAAGGVVMAGRDIGTVILRDADVKLFLTASQETRARRRFEELRAQGRKDTYEEVLALLRRRDRLDSSREASPLAPAPDARIFETDGLSLDAVVDRLEAEVAARA